MDLILWRHAEAFDLTPGGEDLERALTPKGEKQAQRVAAWLDRQLPEGARIVVSPALRCEQTALALGRKFKKSRELLPEATPQALLDLVRWPDYKGTALVVGHQPTLGHTIAQLLQLPEADCAVKKGAVWWLRHRLREQGPQTVIVTVQSPDLL
jgi:phosphohistidine phosphatase